MIDKKGFCDMQLGFVNSDNSCNESSGTIDNTDYVFIGAGRGLHYLWQ